MIRIGVIGPETSSRPRQIKDFAFKLKKTYGDDCQVYSGGNKTGVEMEVKRQCLTFNIPYKEFNPSFTGHNLYSALPESYYSKGKHPSHYLHRYTQMLYQINYLVIAKQEDDLSWKIYEAVARQAQRRGIKTIFI